MELSLSEELRTIVIQTISNATLDRIFYQGIFNTLIGLILAFFDLILF